MLVFEQRLATAHLALAELQFVIMQTTCVLPANAHAMVVSAQV